MSSNWLLFPTADAFVDNEYFYVYTKNTLDYALITHFLVISEFQILGIYALQN